MTGNLINKTIRLGKERTAVEDQMTALASVVPDPFLSAVWARIDAERQDTIQAYLAGGGALATLQRAIRMHRQDR